MVGTALSIVLKLLTWILHMSDASDTAKEMYFSFLTQMAADASNSSTLRQSAIDQKNEIFAAIDADKLKKDPPK